MNKVKCITFDRNAQDSLPQHIKDKMKADRDNARSKRELEITVLTVENAPTVSIISNIQNPEWRKQKFNFGGNMSSWGVGCNSAMLFEHEYKFWKVESFK